MCGAGSLLRDIFYRMILNTSKRSLMVRAFIIATVTELALAQTPVVENSSASALTVASATSGRPSSVTVAPGDTVLTIRGICPLEGNPLSSSADNCTAALRRKQFDALLKVVAPAAEDTPSTKRSLAKTYANLLAFEAAAEKDGLDRSTQFMDSMEWVRLRMLADLYRHNLEKETSVVSDQEIDDYYRQHVSEFEEVKLRRMLVPKSFVGVDKQEAERRALEIATEFRERAAKGEDLDQLQKEAYIAAGFNSLPPTTEVGTRRRSGLSSDVSGDIFALRPGEVTKVEKEPYSFVIYKVDVKHTLPKEKVREEISREIAKQKLDAALQSVTAGIHTDLNGDYFGSASEQ